MRLLVRPETRQPVVDLAPVTLDEDRLCGDEVLTPSTHGVDSDCCRPGRIFVALSVGTALVVALASACSAGGGQGAALRGAGITSWEVLPPHPHPGAVYALSFPFMVNRSDRQVTVTGFSVQNVPRGLRVLGYRVLNTNETHGLINVGYLGGGSRKDNVTAYRDYFGKSITVPPRSPSSYYAMVEVRLTGKVRTDLTGCVVHYTTAGERFTQTLGCAYRFRPF